MWADLIHCQQKEMCGMLEWCQVDELDLKDSKEYSWQNLSRRKENWGDFLSCEQFAGLGKLLISDRSTKRVCLEWEHSEFGFGGTK